MLRNMCLLRISKEEQLNIIIERRTDGRSRKDAVKGSAFSVDQLKRYTLIAYQTDCCLLASFVNRWHLGQKGTWRTAPKFLLAWEDHAMFLEKLCESSMMRTLPSERGVTVWRKLCWERKSALRWLWEGRLIHAAHLKRRGCLQLKLFQTKTISSSRYFCCVIYCRSPCLLHIISAGWLHLAQVNDRIMYVPQAFSGLQSGWAAQR